MTNCQEEFWKTKSLDQMSESEWESLCDGCGKCCLVKLQNEQTDEIHYTCLACKLLDIQSCRCRNYSKRKEIVPNCLILRPLTKNLAAILPLTCAYRLLYQGKPLPGWHPLVTGDENSTISAGMSIVDKAISEQHIHPDDMEDYIID